MTKTLRLLTTLSILASSLIFTHSASAIGTLYSSGTGSGDVACSGGGYFSVLNNVAIDGGGSCRGSVVIPDGVTSLAVRSFMYSDITSVTIPSGVTSIGEQAFLGSKLTSIVIPSSVTSIGGGAFETSRLVSVTIPGSVTNLGNGLFASAIYLTSAVFESGIRTIPTSTFQSAEALTSVTIPNTVTSIGNLAFTRTCRLTSITIPNSVTSIGEYAFYQGGTGCGLTSITIPSTVVTIQGGAFVQTPQLLSYSYCRPGLNISTLAGTGLEGKTRLTCPAVISTGRDGISRSVTFPDGVKVAEIPASSALPSIKLDFALTAPAILAVFPTSNLAPLSATPFMTSGSTRIVDIQIENHDGSDVTICLEGDSTDRLYHYTAGAWVELEGRSYVNGQVCGVTNSFSPFTAAPAKLVTNSAAAEKAAADAAAAKRETERRDARNEILRRYAKSEAVTVETYQRAEISGITSTNVEEFNKEILRLPIEKRGDVAEISKVARKYEVVGLIGSDRIKSVYPSQYIEIGLIPENSKYKTALAAAIKKLPAEARDSFAEIKAAIDAQNALIQKRADRLSAIRARSGR